MSEQSDTPETDEVSANPNSVHAKFFLMRDLARKLERERDEARNVAKKWRNHWLAGDCMSMIATRKLPWETEKPL